MLPERDVAAIKAYCERRNEPETSDQLHVEAGRGHDGDDR
jgi:hypothetical protein